MSVKLISVYLVSSCILVLLSGCATAPAVSKSAPSSKPHAVSGSKAARVKPVEKAAKADLSAVLDSVKREGGWDATPLVHAAVFNSVRASLETDFPPALRRFVRNDLDRCYWCALFLSDPEYLGRQKSDLPLALELYSEALELRADPASDKLEDRLRVCRLLEIRVRAAILCLRLGEAEKALSLKREVEALLWKYPVYGGSFPVLSEEDSRIYNRSIP